MTLLGLLFAICHRHQQHLENLKSAHDEVARLVPTNSVVVANSTLVKLFGVPGPDVPAYRWMSYSYATEPVDNSAKLRTVAGTWYLAILPKEQGSEIPDLLQNYVTRYGMKRVPTHHPTLILYAADPDPNHPTGPTAPHSEPPGGG